jgi:hypothetical protein
VIAYLRERFSEWWCHKFHKDSHFRWRGGQVRGFWSGRMYRILWTRCKRCHETYCDLE